MNDAARSGALLALALAVATALPAQALRQERRTYARVLELRAELAVALRDAPAERRAAVVAALQREEDALTNTARALALARGVEPDAEYLHRAVFQGFALPEVIDTAVPLPGKDEAGVQLTAHTPFRPPGELPIRLEFVLVGPERASVPFAETYTNDDLSGFRATQFHPATKLAPGAWRADLLVTLDGRKPREQDLVSSAPFFVAHGFVARREQLLDRLAELAPALGPEQRAAGFGALAPVERVYQGEPPQGRSRALQDLANAERVVRNLGDGAAPLQDLRGWVASALPLAGETVALCARRCRETPADTPRPIVVFMPGVPTWDGVSARPGGLEILDPWSIVDALERAQFDAGQKYELIVLESPGRGPAPGQALTACIETLRRQLGGSRVVLVAEREAATVACLALPELRPHLAGLVLVSGGGLGPREIAAHAELPILAIPAAEHPMSENLLRMPQAAGEATPQLELLPPEQRPWPVALELALGRIEQFVADRQQ